MCCIVVVTTASVRQLQTMETCTPRNPKTAPLRYTLMLTRARAFDMWLKQTGQGFAEIHMVMEKSLGKIAVLNRECGITYLTSPARSSRPKD